jgi:Ca2+-binding EF-hand superfamily protein
VNNKDRFEGVEVFSEEFSIAFKKYDDDNNMNIDLYRLVAKNGNFGINTLVTIENKLYKNPLLQKVNNNENLEANS